MASWARVTCAYFIGIRALTRVFFLLMSIFFRLVSLNDRITKSCDCHLNPSSDVLLSQECWVENLSRIQDFIRVEEFLDVPLQVPNLVTKFIHHPLTFE